MNWTLFAPELWCFLGAAVFLLTSFLARPNPRRDYFVALVMAGTGIGVSLAAVGSQGLLFFDAYRIDLYSQVFKVLLSSGLFLVVSVCSELNGVEEEHHPEFYLLLFVCTLAMMMLASGVHLLSIYVSLELSSYSLYILVSLRRQRAVGVAAAVKYFLVGISASAVLLFGFAMLYGATGAASLQEVLRSLPGDAHRPLAIVGFVCVLGGLLFKLAVFPFHFWAPDAYQGAPNQVTTYIATASKVGAVAVLCRVVAAGGGNSEYLVRVLVALAILSMTVGNLAAIVQKDLKRLFAYSSIAHAGYVLIGILSMNRAGYAAAIFYAVAVLVMKFTGFLVVVKVAHDGSNLQVSELAGLHRRSPILAMALMVSLFSLAGLPPTIGFTGKFLVFAAAMHKGYFALVLLAMINVVVSLYYYLLILKAAYLQEADPPLSPIPVSPVTRLLAGTLSLAILAIGFFPHALIALATRAAEALLASGA